MEEIKKIKVNGKDLPFQLGNTINIFRDKIERKALIISIKLSLDESIYYELEWEVDKEFYTDWFSERELKRLIEISQNESKIGFS